MDVNKASFRQLSFGVLDDDSTQEIMGVAFSPNSNTIYFLRQTDYSGPGFSPRSFGPPDTNLYSMDLATSRLQQLTQYRANYMSELAVSQDGRFLLFLLLKVYASLKHEHFIVLYDLQEPSRSRLIPIEYKWNVSTAALSPNSQYVVFSGPDGLLKMDIETQQTSDLTSLDTRVSEVEFFHAKNEILFLAQTLSQCGVGYGPSAPPCRWQLMNMDSDGSNVRTINIDVPERGSNTVVGAPRTSP